MMAAVQSVSFPSRVRTMITGEPVPDVSVKPSKPYAGSAWARALLLLSAVTVLAALALGAVGRWRPRETTAPASQDQDPRRSFATAFRNVRPEVAYVGDEACAFCHAGHAETYRQHPMGRALAPLGAADQVERFGPETHNPFHALGATFEVIPRGRHVVHRQVNRNARGEEVAVVEAEVSFVLGSGRQGRSYLLNRGGYLFQSPISWYSGEKVWDLSPGYKKNFFGFARQITVDCLFCHSNRVEPVAHTVNRYEEPIFRGYVVGCERCHGPGELHVDSRQRGEHPDGNDFTIVNPRHLEPALREAVCQQCHLQGEIRIPRRGRSPFDYRPGLPLHLIESAFVRPPELTSGHKSVGHVEQMYQSRCFEASSGKLGCISCHDPHALPAPEKRVAFYRGRCLQCHEERNKDSGIGNRDAASKRSESRSRIPDSRFPIAVSCRHDCIACHMQHGESDNIVHAAVTDHRILRRPDQPPRIRRDRLPSEIPLVHFHRDLVEPGDTGVERDLGLAMIQIARFSNFDALAQRVGRTALPLLTVAVADAPDDVEAWEARGHALWLAGRREEALTASESALALAPNSEIALRDAAFFAANLGRDELAIRYWKQLLEVNPWQEPTHFNLGKMASARGEWDEVLRQCEAGLRIDPTSVESRQLLVLYYANNGKPDRARTEFDKMLALNPPKADEFRRWFATLGVPK